jgi:hypothetical protein
MLLLDLELGRNEMGDEIIMHFVFQSSFGDLGREVAEQQTKGK